MFKNRYSIELQENLWQLQAVNYNPFWGIPKKSMG
jgi:hypothetical protein